MNTKVFKSLIKLKRSFFTHSNICHLIARAHGIGVYIAIISSALLVFSGLSATKEVHSENTYTKDVLTTQREGKIASSAGAS